jgi:hypothetical protein
MFQVKRTGENRLDVQLSGKLDSDELHLLVDHLMNASTGFTHGRMRYSIHDFDRPSLGALAMELSQVAQLFILIRRFERCAVIADKRWLRIASKIEGALIPGLKIKAFTPDEALDAESWLDQP